MLTPLMVTMMSPVKMRTQQVDVSDAETKARLGVASGNTYRWKVASIELPDIRFEDFVRATECLWFTCGQTSTLSSAVLLHLSHKRAHLRCSGVFHLDAVGLQSKRCKSNCYPAASFKACCGQNNDCWIRDLEARQWCIQNVINYRRGCSPEFQSQMFRCLAFPAQLLSFKKRRKFFHILFGFFNEEVFEFILQFIWVYFDIFTFVGQSNQPVSWSALVWAAKQRNRRVTLWTMWWV